MLAKSDAGRLRSGPEWVYEYKLDGYRCCLRIAADGTTVLTSRNGIDFTDEFPELAEVYEGGTGVGAVVLDGEIVTYDEHGRVEFALLQERRGRYRAHAAAPKRETRFDDVAVRFLAFDLLREGDTPLLHRPLVERRERLAEIPMPDPYRVAVLRAVGFDELAADRRTPQDLLATAAADGAEGLVAKLRDASYSPGKRPGAWLKHPLVRTQDVILCGWRPGRNRLTGSLGGLLLGAHDPTTGDLVYLGDVGTGFSERERRELPARLQQRATHPFAVAPPREDVRGVSWVEPELVGEVVYRQFTRGAGRLRHTAWRGLRDDLDPAEVAAPSTAARSAQARVERDEPPVGTAARVTVQVESRRLTISNLDKPLYPCGFTKGEVIHYYSRIAPILLPHLENRPVTLIRYPDGVGGEQFYEKNAPNGKPDWLRTAHLPSTGSRSGRGPGVIEYLLLDDLPGLVWVANLAALELHVPQWAVGGGDRRLAPDRVVFDLDPGPGTTIVECARVAEHLHDVLTADGLGPVACTSGGKGMQIYAALHADDPATAAAYAKTVAERFAAESPDAVTAKMTKALRTGKVLIDWSQNNPAKTTITPYSLRGREQPTVATPLTWDEVRACRHADQLVFAPEDVLDRVEHHGDLLARLAHGAALRAR
ncbi:DNA ligase D [Actinokineospora auranticolor]|nr:DNA ligase D [Actinokineospora auranticolor]